MKPLSLKIIHFFFITVFVNTLQAQILDDIHYYVTDRKAVNAFFETNFNAKQMADQPMNPLAFINFLQINPQQSTINISAQGPFAGIKVGDPKRWEKTLVKPAAANPAVYGVHWVCFATKNLQKSTQQLLKNGAIAANKNIKLPLETATKTATFYTPDYNLIVLVERKYIKKSKFTIDHLQFLVNNLKSEVEFYTTILGAKILKKKPHSVKLEVGRHIFILSEPEGLVIDREQVIKKESSKFIPGIDHIGFLYKDFEAMTQAYNSAIEKGYKGLMKPTQMMYYDKPTPYTFGILFSPEGFQIEFEIEAGGRYGPRTVRK
jgi:catechol 2,3-dioxygenase-like lactoylglutathione lyase family enzyme